MIWTKTSEDIILASLYTCGFCILGLLLKAVFLVFMYFFCKMLAKVSFYALKLPPMGLKQCTEQHPIQKVWYSIHKNR